MNHEAKLQFGAYFRSWIVDRPVHIVAPKLDWAEELWKQLANPVGDGDPISIALDLATLSDLDENLLISPLALLQFRSPVPVNSIRAAFPSVEVNAFAFSIGDHPRIQISMEPCASLFSIGRLPLPQWPAVGIAMPCAALPQHAVRAASGLVASYPGYLHVVIVANGLPRASTELLKELVGTSTTIEILELSSNRGFASACNAGLNFLWPDHWYDLFGVAHDDIDPDFDCISQLATAFHQLTSAGHSVGAVGPYANGAQQLQLFADGTLEQFHSHRHSLHSSANEVPKLDTTLMLFPVESLNDVGGFDPVFSYGFGEDDDFSTRLRLAGKSLWAVPGAFVQHEGRATMRALDLRTNDLELRNREIFDRKWNPANTKGIFEAHGPRALLFQPLAEQYASTGIEIEINGQWLDLVTQASDIEFAAWVYKRLQAEPAESRRKLASALLTA